MKLVDYIRGRRKGKEARRLELEAQADPFLGEALEGFDAVEGDHGEALDRLSARLAERTRGARTLVTPPTAAASTPAGKRTPLWRRPALWGSVASLFIVLGISVVFYRNFMTEPRMTAYDYSQDIMEEIPITRHPAVADSSVYISGDNLPPPSLHSPALVGDVLDVVHNSVEITVPMEISFEEFSEDAVYIKPFEKIESAVEEDASFSARRVIGRVYDENGEPLIGASVRAGASATVTDVNGQFMIYAPGSEKTVRADFLGYKGAAATIGDDGGEVVISLVSDNQSLDEVVVIGYGTNRKISGRVAGVTTEKTKESRKRAKGRDDLDSSADFIAVTPSAASPFGMNTGGESYRKIQGLINEARRPAVEDVNTGEMVNYFYYTYEKPSGNEPVSIDYEVGDCPWNPANKLVIVAITAGEAQGKKSVRDLDLKVNFNPANVASYRLVGYEDMAAGQSSISSDSGWTQGQESLLALYEIVPVGGTDTVGNLMNLDLSYKEPGSRKSKSLKKEVKLTGIPPSDNFWFASAVAMFGEILRGSDEVGDAGYDLVIETAGRGLTGENAAARREFIRLVETAKEMAQ